MALEPEEKLVMLCAAAIFLPFFIGSATAMLASAAVLIKRGWYRMAVDRPYARRLFLFILFFAAVAFFNENWFGLGAMGAAYLYVILAFFAVSVMSAALRDRIIRLFCLLSVLCAAVAVAQLLFFHFKRAPSTFFNANYYGYVCELMVLVSIYAFFTLTPRWLYLLSAFVNLAAIAVADCRSAWPAAAAGLIAMLLYLKKYKAFALASGATILCAVSLYLYPALSPRLFALPDDTVVREHLWKLAIEQFTAYPLFGQGILSFYFVQRFFTAAHTHNFLLELLVSFGVVGIAALCFYAAPALTQMFKSRRPVNALVLAALVASLVHGITDVPFFGFQTALLLGFILALTGARKEDAAEPAETG